MHAINVMYDIIHLLPAFICMMISQQSGASNITSNTYKQLIIVYMLQIGNCKMSEYVSILLIHSTFFSKGQRLACERAGAGTVSCSPVSVTVDLGPFGGLYAGISLSNDCGVLCVLLALRRCSLPATISVRIIYVEGRRSWCLCL